MQIAAELIVIPQGCSRRSLRCPVNFVAWVRESDLPLFSARIADISEHGCRLIGIGQCDVGSELIVKISGLNGLRATVVRAADDEVGCEFSAPLHPADLALLLRLHQTSVKKAIFQRG